MTVKELKQKLAWHQARVESLAQQFDTLEASVIYERPGWSHGFAWDRDSLLEAQELESKVGDEMDWVNHYKDRIEALKGGYSRLDR